jgi:hypothetical protein
MTPWILLAETRVDLHRDEVPAYVRAQFGSGLRRAGISAEFTIASAAASWRGLEPRPQAPCLAMIFTSLTFAGSETAACIKDLLEAETLPMPFQFIASQPHLAATHAWGLFPGLDQVTTLVGSPDGVETALLPALARRRAWTHVLLGEVSTPAPQEGDGGRFRSRWRILATAAPPP